MGAHLQPGWFGTIVITLQICGRCNCANRKYWPPALVPHVKQDDATCKLTHIAQLTQQKVITPRDYRNILGTLQAANRV